MIYRLLAVSKNTFFETLRQPIYAVIVVAALLLLTLSPAISAYTLDEDIKLLRELGLSTIFLSGLFIAAFCAASALTEEIETGAVTTVLTKPISRPTFIAGKFLGLAAAVSVSHWIFSIGYLMAIRHGVLERASDEIDWTVIAAASAAVAFTIVITAFLNYAYDINAPSAMTLSAAVLFGIALLFLVFVDKEWKLNPQNNQFKSFDVYASVLLLMGVWTLTAIALCLSARLNVIMTLTGSVAVFLLGLINDWAFGRWAERNIQNAATWLEKAGIIASKIAAAIFPNFQIFWVSDAIYEKGVVPAAYLISAAIYTIFYVIAVVGLAMALFQRRQIG